MYRRCDINLSRFVNNEIYLRTLRIDGRMSREDAIRKLATAGVDISDIEGIYREGENNPWHAVLKSREKAGSISADGIKNISNLIIDLRIHWLPLYVNDLVIKEVLKPYGDVLEITRDKTIITKDNTLENGTRIVKFRTTDFDSRNIPHIVSLGVCGMLITMKGRPPICLKCRQTGHLRKDCPEKGASYASVVNKDVNVRRNAAPSPPETSPTEPKQSTSSSEEITITNTPATPSHPSTTQTTEVEIEEEIHGETAVGEQDVEEENANSAEKRELFDMETYKWETVSSKKAKKARHDIDDSTMDMHTS
ncbi:hypothetical protein ACJMK2_038799 [Sinanodonta woodiana]|uniref:CCHC-type domain-containing protein n=1 Tax=Sinanodonta woodiana TaxID=1069815 RepID=A0ABD3WA25_SINWO